MKKNFLSLMSFAVVCLLVSALPVSAQSRTQARNRDRDYVNELTRANLARVGGGNYGWGRVGSNRSYGWGQVGQQAVLMGLEAIIVRQQVRDVIAMSQPPPPPVFDYYQPPPALVYQQQQEAIARSASRTSLQEMLPPPPSQTCGETHEWVENASADRLYVIITDGNGQQEWGKWVFSHQKVCAPYVERGWTITGSYDARMVQGEHTVGTTTDCRVNLNPVPGFGWRSASRCDSNQVKEN